MIDEKDLEEFMDLLYPYFIKKLKDDGMLKNNVKMKNATVKSIPRGTTNIGAEIKVALPYEENEASFFSVINKTGAELSVGDTVCLMYWVDLKNAVAMFKAM